MKLYPYSLSRAHDVEFYANRLFNTKCAMENGEIPMDNDRYDRIVNMYYGELQELRLALLNSVDGHVAFINGAQIALAKKITAWAMNERSTHCKPEYAKYC